MKTIYLDDDSAGFMPCVATVGFFDGVHCGHKHLLNDVSVISNSSPGLKSMAITFDTHPRKVVAGDGQPQLLTTTEEKLKLLSLTDIEVCVVLRFTREMAAMPAFDFMKKILAERLQVRTLVMGYDNRFGHNKNEGFEQFAAYGRQLGIEVIKGDTYAYNQVKVSSSVVRSLLNKGMVEDAAKCLGRCYFISGTVVHGEGVGHTIGFPTANLQIDDDDKLVPMGGAYAVRVHVSGMSTIHNGMMNIGRRPTYHGAHRTLEVNIFDFDSDIYGRQVTVEFVRRLRDEMKFSSSAKLAAQLDQDREAALFILNKYK